MILKYRNGTKDNNNVMFCKNIFYLWNCERLMGPLVTTQLYELKLKKLIHK